VTTSDGEPVSGLRESVRGFIESARFEKSITALIVANAITLGIETSPQVVARFGHLLHAFDRAVLGVFVVELLLRFFVHRGRFFADPWRVFDFVVVAIALVPASGPLAVLRALRVLRVLRLLSIVPSMRRVVGALLAAIPGLGSIALVLLILYYVFAVIATSLFGASHPDWFGHIGRSQYTLFQIMTLESWSMGIARPVMSEFPYAWIFFVAFILVATFTMLNLFFPIIVNAMQRYSDGEPQNAEAMPRDADVRDELRALRAEIERLRLGLHARRGCGQP